MTLALATMLWLIWPASGEQDIRARTASALALGTQAAALVGAHFQQTQKLPDSVEQLGFVLPADGPVSAMELDFRMGILSLLLQGDGLDAQQLLLVPTADEQNQLTWECLSIGVAEQHLPPSCRPAQPAEPVIVE